MSRTLTLFHGSKKLDLSFETPRTPRERDRIIGRAKHRARSNLIERGTTISAEAWSNFESNLRRWIDSGFDGQLSVDRAFASEARPTASTSLLDVRHMGTEHELRRYSVKGSSIEYSAELSATDEMSGTPKVVAGTVKTTAGKWPLMALTADQVHGDTGCIEVVFGPVDVSNKAALARRGKAMAALQDSLRESVGGKLEVARLAYNTRIDTLAATDPRMAAYELGPADDVDLGATSDNFNAVQTNIEVPLRKIGDRADTTVPALFGGRNEADDKAMFLEARACANELVDDVFRPTAAGVHGGAYEADSIKLDKMRATFTLLLYSVAKVSQQSRKGAWPVLPKVGSGDLVRESFSARDKAVLYHHTANRGRFDALKEKLVGYATQIKAKRSFLGSLKTGEADAMRYEVDLLLRPGANKSRWGKERKGYGRVNWSDRSYTGTVTGKPIKPGADYVRRTLTKKRPKIVLEIRREGNPINGMVDSLARSPTVEGKHGYDVLAAAAAQPEDTRTKKAEVTE